VDAKKSGGGPSRSRFESDSFVFDVLRTPGGGTLLAASIGVRHIELVALLDDPTCLTHDLRGISLDCVDSPFHMEVMLT